MRKSRCTESKTMRKLRLYLDTSVIGGYFDEEFEKHTKRLFTLLRTGVYKSFISESTIFELYKSPTVLVEEIRDLLSEFEYERLVETDESRNLAQAYVDAKVLPPRCTDDARHVAIATCENIDYIISWNCRHLANVERIRQFNAISLQCGYTVIDIRTPLEVTGDENREI